MFRFSSFVLHSYIAAPFYYSIQSLYSASSYHFVCALYTLIPIRAIPEQLVPCLFAPPRRPHVPRPHAPTFTQPYPRPTFPLFWE